MKRISNPKALLIILGFILSVAIFAVNFIPSDCLGSAKSAEAEFPTPININTADASTLCLLQNVGEKTAQNIIAYRTENGGFKTKDELKNVNGIGEKTFESLKNYICTE